MSFIDEILMFATLRMCKGNTLLIFINQVVRNLDNRQKSYIITSTLNN